MSNDEKEKILVADDDLTSRLILTSALKKWNYEPISVTNGKEALEILSQPDSPQIAILDWVMPEIDGIEVVKEVRSMKKEVPPYIIMLTTKTEKEDLMAGLEAGADDYICKPFDNKELWARIKVGIRTINLHRTLVKAQKALEYEALHDPLTGVLNRRGILERLEEEIERGYRKGYQICVAMFDLDHFKKINDTYGHQTGDEVLKGFVKILQNHTRPYDSIGRLGGEEFLLIVPEISESEAILILEKLLNEIRKSPIYTHNNELKITTSIGGIIINGKLNVDKVIKLVDESLYQAKERGRNQLIFHGAIEND
ncbi:MAG: diguanylate cyclase [Candidatus Hydrogenedentes bacterium]|nr:diguanylate cyclase [Candidatus Hydrogenedentota bacterium]